MASKMVSASDLRLYCLDILRKGCPELGMSLTEDDIQAIDHNFPLKDDEAISNDR